MNQAAHDRIRALLDESGVRYAAFSHEPCKTSEESEHARAKAGYPNVTGAKALLTKLYFPEREVFATIVLPGNHVLDKERLISSIPDLRKLRFATPEEMQELAGLVPGSMPPFAAPIFESIPLLIVAEAIGKQKTLGFNSAYLDRSIVLDALDYLSAITPSFVVDCSRPKEGSGHPSSASPETVSLFA